MTERKPAVGERVITHHKFNRIDILKWDGNDFHFPITCPVNAAGEPMHGGASYPEEVITHWMELPPYPKGE
jgi:hypothetical protein